MKHSWLYLALSVFFISLNSGTSAAESGPAKNITDKPAKDSKPADSGSKNKVLDPAQFFGQASFGYGAAKACPEVMAKLFCYCGCDITDNHSSLLDCFTSIHGVDCHICQEEAVMAMKLNRDGTPIEQIQKQIDERYSSEYPFEEDTPAYKKYKATRYGHATPAKSSNVLAGPDAPAPTKETIKTKSGKPFKPSSCCSGADHEAKTPGKK